MKKDIMKKSARPSWRTMLIATSLAVLTACGGGGGSGAASGAGGTSGSGSTGGSGGTNPSASLVVTPTSLSVTADTSDEGAAGTLQVFVRTASTDSIYVFVSTTNNAVASINTGQDGAYVDVNVVFKTPAIMGVGTYTDTITFNACYDQPCTQPISNSPLTVPVTYTVTLAAPVVSALTPITASAGAPGFTLTVDATNVTNTSQVLWDGSPRPTTVDGNTLTAQITAADIAQPGMATVQVQTGTALSGENTFDVTPPQVSQYSPMYAAAGSPGFTLTVNGGYFQSTAQVLWNGSPRATTYVNSTQLAAQITAADIAVGGSGTISVETGGLQTPGYPLEISPLAGLTFTRISPADVPAGSASFYLSAAGTGFATTSVVTWNGSALTTTYVSSKLLRALVPAGLIASTGAATVTVVNPAAQGGASGMQTVTIIPPNKDATSYQIGPEHAGAANFANLTLPSASSWSVDVGGAPSYAVIAGGQVFVTVQVSATGSQVLALNAATGAVTWGPIALTGSANLAYDDGRLFMTVGTYEQRLQSLDPASGNVLWSVIIPGSSNPEPPVAAGGVVYATGTFTVTAFDESTGAILWSGMVGSSVGTVAVSIDGVYDASLCDVADLMPGGTVLWDYNIGCGDGAGGTTPVAADGSVYWMYRPGVSAGRVLNAESGVAQGSFSANQTPAFSATTGFYQNNGSLQAQTLSDHHVLWSFTGDGQLTNAPLVVNDYVFIGSTSGLLYALDATSGTLVWSQALGAAIPAGTNRGVGIMYTGLSAGDGLLVVPNGTKVTAFTLSTSP